MAAGFFAEVGYPGAKVDTTRHPFMHRTPTVDYIMLLSGKAALLVDEGEPVELRPFDAVIQRGTNHMWVNTGTEDAVFMGAMVGGMPAGPVADA
jgi:quercetin dioxygenase-like cupin family protein